MRIVTLTLHPAIDRVLAVRKIVPGGTFDARLLLTVPAGKGVNTARSLRCLRIPNTKIIAAVWAGREESPWFTTRLDAEGIRAAVCERDVSTRYTATFLEESGRETHVKESMPAPVAGEEARLLNFWRRTVHSGDVIALCGSAPPNTNVSTLKKIIEIARTNRAIRIIADTNGVALDVAGRAGTDGIKGNAAEIGAWLKLGSAIQIRRREHQSKLLHAIRRENGPRAILVTMGSSGAAFATGSQLFASVAPKLPKTKHRLGSATGCGDAATAGWLWAIQENCSVEETLVRAVACGTAKLLSADPGALDPKLVRRLLTQINVTQLQ